MQDAMYIYALSRRKQGKMHLIGDADWNIMGGGIRVTNAETGKKIDVKLTPTLKAARSNRAGFANEKTSESR